jgi:hypothetical protein
MTLFEALDADVTAKAKSIALTAIWGPEYEASFEENFAELSRRMESRGEATDGMAKARATFQRILAVKDPDEFA